MQARLRRHAHSIASAVLCAFGLVFSMTCVAQAEADACCAEMAECGVQMAVEHGCCRTEAPRFDQQLAAVTKITAPLPPITTIVVAFLDAVGTLHSRERVATRSDASPPLAHGVPPYLLLATLRI